MVSPDPTKHVNVSPGSSVTESMMTEYSPSALFEIMYRTVSFHNS